VTFTGLDIATRSDELIALSRDFPIEWGILFNPKQEGSGRYPTLAHIQSVAELDLKFSAHLCGEYARSVVNGETLPATVASLLNRFSRIQVNTAKRNVEPEQIARFAERFGARGILQCRGLEDFPDDARVDWLFDRSGGKGLLPEQWPVPQPSAAFVGYSGGLGPDTVANALAAIAHKHPELVRFWIDMEGAIRTDDLFDVRKCRRVCEIVYG
jgi:hypothetical protein